MIMILKCQYFTIDMDSNRLKLLPHWRVEIQNPHPHDLLSSFSAIKMFKKTGEVFCTKPGEEVPKVFTFDSVYDWK